MIEGLIVFTCGLTIGIFINVIGVLKNQSFHSKRFDEVENKIDEILKNLKNE